MRGDGRVSMLAAVAELRVERAAGGSSCRLSGLSALAATLKLRLLAELC